MANTPNVPFMANTNLHKRCRPLLVPVFSKIFAVANAIPARGRRTGAQSIANVLLELRPPGTSLGGIALGA